MKILNLFELTFRCLLFALILYHLFKREYKIITAAILTLLLSFLPKFLSAIFQVKTDSLSIFVYDIVLLMSLYLGSSLGFYDRYQWWDRVIHFLSGLGFVGFGMAAVARINPGIVKSASLLFGFTFSITLHVFWELCEYISDCLSHGNAQRWQKIHDSNNHVAEKAIQPAGLVDTMNDFICCVIGAALAVVLWCSALS